MRLQTLGRCRFGFPPFFALHVAALSHALLMYSRTERVRGVRLIVLVLLLVRSAVLLS